MELGSRLPIHSHRLRGRRVLRASCKTPQDRRQKSNKGLKKTIREKGLNCANLVSPNNLVRSQPSLLCSLTRARSSRNSPICCSRLLCSCGNPFPVRLRSDGAVAGFAVMSLAPLGRLLPVRASTGRPAKDRNALATAFIAKAILHLPTTRDLISRLRVDESLRQFWWLCPLQAALPHESKFLPRFRRVRRQ